MRNGISRGGMCLTLGTLLTVATPTDGQEIPTPYRCPARVDEGVAFDQEFETGIDGLLTRTPLVVVDPATPEVLSPAQDDSGVPAVPVQVAGALLAAEEAWVDVVVVFTAQDRLSPLPTLVPGIARTDELNQTILARRRELLEAAAHRRLAKLAGQLGIIEAMSASPVEYFLFGNAMAARIPVERLFELSVLPGVVSVETVQTNAAPPDTDPDNDVVDGRTQINSDLFWNYDYTGAGTGQYVGVLDTGVRSSHSLLSGANQFSWQLDCVYGSSTCSNLGDPNYSSDDSMNHGTSSCAILSGNSSLGDAYRGVSNVTLDSFKVYTSAGASTTAVLRGFSQAIQGGDDVILAQVAVEGSETTSISLAADDAYDAGAVVIAPVGDVGPWASTVRAPANAHKALGVGAYDVKNGTTYASQSRGPTNDSRIKPDFQMPTNTETASTACSTCLQVFGATSGAAPYAAGMAILLFDYFNTQGWMTNPGVLYAAMIGFGDRPYSAFDNVQGVGHLALGDLSCRRWVSGARNVYNGDNIDLPLTFSQSGNGDRDLRVAIWWPEGTSYHNDIDISVIDPNGSTRASSTSSLSVFEFTTISGALTPAGSWKIRLRGYSVLQAPQTVYYFAYHKTWCAP